MTKPTYTTSILTRINLTPYQLTAEQFGGLLNQIFSGPQNQEYFFHLSQDPYSILALLYNNGLYALQDLPHLILQEDDGLPTTIIWRGRSWNRYPYSPHFGVAFYNQASALAIVPVRGGGGSLRYYAAQRRESNATPSRLPTADPRLNAANALRALETGLV